MSAGLGLFELVGDGGAPDARLSRANAAFAQLLEARPEQLVGQTVSALWPELAPRVLSSLLPVARTGATDRFEQYDRPRRRWLSVSLWSPGPGRVAVLMFDITGLRQQRVRPSARGEARARRELKQLRELLLGIPLAVVLVDWKGKILDMNPAALCFHGFHDAERLPRNVLDFNERFELHRPFGPALPPESWPLARALRGERIDAEVLELRRVDIPMRRVGAYSAFNVHGEAGEQALTVLAITDLSAIRSAEAALSRSEERFRRLAENSPIGLSLATRGGALTYANPAMIRHLGYREEELASGTFSWKNLLAPEESELDARVLDLLERTGRYGPFEKTLVAKDGTRLPVLMAIAVIDREGGDESEAAAYVADLRPLKQAEQALRESEQRFRAAVSHLPHPFLIYDADRRIQFVNDAGLAVMGKTAEELLGRRDEEAVPQELVNGYLPQLKRAFRTRQPQAFEWTLPPAWGDRTCAVNYVPLLAGRGELQQVLCIAYDVTERKRAEEHIREKDRHKDEFLAVLSHELRNPLAPVRNSLFVLSHAAPGSEPARRGIAVIDRQVRHLTRLVEDLLDVTRIGRGKILLKRTRFDLGELVRRTVEDHRLAFANAGVRLELAPPRQPVWVEGDPTRLAQVIGNLLHNSMKFTPAGGRVTVALSPEGGEARLSVEDTGAGITSDLLPRLFTPFTQAEHTRERRRGGLGLGLALVKGLVEQHGGTVHAFSPGIDRGTRMEVRLPLLELRPEAPAPAPAPQP